jgi:glucosamine--fructose-6-phosphate aminotransferase (isomerizing)
MATARCISAPTRSRWRRSPTTISYLEDGDWAVLTRKELTEIFDDERARSSATLKSGASTFMVDKANYRHFMAKEIHEQPEVSVIRWQTTSIWRTSAFRKPMTLPFDFKDHPAFDHRLRHRRSRRADRKYWFERYARAAGRIDVASEFRYRECRCRKGDLAIFISQSGETADTLASLRYAARQGMKIARGRQRARIDHRARERDRAADAGRPGDRRRLDQGVHLPTDPCWRRLPIAPARRAAISRRATKNGFVRESRRSAASDDRGAEARSQIEKLAREHRQVKDVLYLGRGTSYPLALEGRAEAEGNLLHPRRGLCGRRAEARPDRADRREHAGGRHRAL